MQMSPQSACLMKFHKTVVWVSATTGVQSLVITDFHVSYCDTWFVMYCTFFYLLEDLMSAMTSVIIRFYVTWVPKAPAQIGDASPRFRLKGQR